MKRFISTWNRTSLIKRIAIGVVVGAVLGLLVPKFTVIGLLGDMFVGGLKAIAPLLVFALVANGRHHRRRTDGCHNHCACSFIHLSSLSPRFLLFEETHFLCW